MPPSSNPKIHPLAQPKPRVMRYIQGMPKVELHSHLGGSVDPELAFELLKSPAGIVTYDGNIFRKWEELDAFIRADVQNLPAYLYKYNATRRAFDSLDNIDAIVDRAAARYASENTMYWEMRTALKSLDSNSGVAAAPYTPEQEIEAYDKAIKNARKKYRMAINLILCIRRGPDESHLKMGRQTLGIAKEAMSDGVIVGLDLMGAENDNPARTFAPIFREAKDYGLGVTIHAGEAIHEGSVEQAVQHCRADRVGHATSIERHSDVYESLRDNGRTPVEVCMTSNVNTRAWIAGEEHRIARIEDHPVLRYIYDDLAVVICTDNPVVSNTSLTNEFEILHTTFGRGVGTIIGCTSRAIRATFASQKTKRILRRRLDHFNDDFFATEAT
jgi:adenosine deaminase